VVAGGQARRSPAAAAARRACLPGCPRRRSSTGSVPRRRRGTPCRGPWERWRRRPGSTRSRPPRRRRPSRASGAAAPLVLLLLPAAGLLLLPSRRSCPRSGPAWPALRGEGCPLGRRLRPLGPWRAGGSSTPPRPRRSQSTQRPGSPPLLLLLLLELLRIPVQLSLLPRTTLLYSARGTW